MKTMKKDYMQPSLRVKGVMTESLLVGVSAEVQGIQYGGVDTEGDKEVDARELYISPQSVWDD